MVSNLKTKISVILVAIFCCVSVKVYAHCDTLDGPVVMAARKALDSGNINFVLIWVKAEDEKEIKDAFSKTLSVRKIGGEAKELADRYFFETLVRIHRAGEGAPYTGLKTTTKDFGPAIPAADSALESGDIEPVMKMLDSAVSDGIKNNFHRTIKSKKFGMNDVRSGREYVKNYVTFIHYVERLYESATASTHGHFAEAKAEGHKD